jgi:hypothetical protein
VSSREERVARNEETSREINEKIEDAHEEAAQESQGQNDRIRMVCECGREECDRLVAITLAEYDQVRSDPRQFVMVREHVVEDVDRIVSETDRFVLAVKREGTPAHEVTDGDPRG